MGSLILNDIIVTLFPSNIRFDRTTYEELCKELYEIYDTQSRSTSSYRFSNQAGGSCVIDTRHIRITDFFAEQSAPAVIRPVAQAARATLAVLGTARADAYDVQISARLPQKELDNGSRINFLSSEEFISARFLQDVDYSPLGGESTGVGLRFLYHLNGTNYDLRIEPYFKDRTYLFLDLGIQYMEARLEPADFQERLLADITYLERNVVSFIRWNNAHDVVNQQPTKETP